ncbi:Protein N-acetyltransferase, RimJ/RimL family [Laceyella tengchongensis]|uniref:Protein N-acetyltransferase, RimJ/RimL family n=2 Tax=Laceyella tengchongensis TaxID=574699 RepID=A0AA45WS41_9BACL|nr:GNAT family N-acetyltransferase [Laceyella tengchongensis]SMP33980.1 Protein N-acetyltransferase, RimJ/RimL family [Laceyella tengchongensis]
MQLTGWRYSLHLLHPTHAEPLYSIVKDSPRLWDYMITPMTSLEDMKHNVNNALHAFAQGTMLPFVVIDSSTNTIVGATRLYDLYTDRLTAEIGHTYYAPYAQGTGINTECKYLLFQHAFENLGLVRVQLKTDERNLRAQRAIDLPHKQAQLLHDTETGLVRSLPGKRHFSLRQRRDGSQ